MRRERVLGMRWNRWSTWIGTGGRHRAVHAPRRLAEPLREHLARVEALHQRDLAAGAGEAVLPDALARKYPRAGREWCWQYVFPSQKLDVGTDGVIRRWHVAAATLQKALKEAVARAGITKPASVHSLRHAYATHLLLQGVDIRRVQELMGHRSIETTMIYTHVVRTMGPEVRSPLDEL
ncbi:MAG: tyrosine-type recombinase/integrase [Candidatus Latescibacterota bacterium]